MQPSRNDTNILAWVISHKRVWKLLVQMHREKIHLFYLTVFRVLFNITTIMVLNERSFLLSYVHPRSRHKYGPKSRQMFMCLPNKSAFISSYTLLKFSCVYPEAQELECCWKKVSLEVELAKYTHANLLHGSKERLLVRVAVWRLWDVSGRCLVNEREVVRPKTSVVRTKSAFKPLGSITFWIANVLLGVCKALEPIHDVERNTEDWWQ